MRSPRLALALGALLGGACKKSPPPVDFRSAVPPRDAPAASAATPDAEASPPRVLDAGPPFQVREGEPVPGDGLTVTLGDRSVHAPPGQRFSQRIAWDYDRDGTAESFFLARVLASGEAAGLSLLRPSSGEAVLGPVEGPEPEDRSCGNARFRQTSPRALVVEWSCPADRPEGNDASPRGMFRAESVLMGPIDNDIGFRARAGILRQALPDTELALSIEGTDLDGDGHDELVCHVAAGRPGAEPGARARVVFFRRNNAYVRDTAEPGASIRALIAAQRRRAGDRRTAPAALAAMEDLQRLRRALCGDTVFARFKLAGNVGVRCDSTAFEGAPEVMLRAYVAMGELPAAWALTRAESAHPFGVVPFARVRSLLEGASTPERGVTATISPEPNAGIDRVPHARTPVARWEDPRDPQRIVLPGDHAMRLTVADWSSTNAPDLNAPNALSPTDLGASQRFVGLAWTRRGLDVVLCPASDAACSAAWTNRPGAVPPGATPRTLPLLPPEDVPLGDDPGPYAQAYVGDDGRLLGWGAEGMLLAVRGLVWRVAPGGEVSRMEAGATWGGSYPAGQSVTEDGAVAALAAPEGLWIHEGTAWRRLSPDTLRDRMALLRDAAPSADGRAFALRFEDNRVAVLRRAPARR